MTEWTTALGGQRLDDERITFDTAEPARLAIESTVVSPLVHLGVLDVSGADAERFLQGQASAQMTLADGDFAPLTTFCTPKGRMLANAQLLRIAPGHFRMIMHRGLVESLAEHLRKFAAFYKAELEVRDDLALIGMIGHDAEALAEVRFDLLPPAVWHQAGDAETQLLTHPGPQPRLMACLPAEQAPALWERLLAQAEPVGNSVWRLQDIQAGLAWLTPAHRDALLPQMINWEALGGISFKKGCYTGQEVVARAHFRGQVKKRLVRAQLDGGLLPELGSDIVDQAEKVVGEVIAAELDAYDEAEILAVMSTKEDLGPLRVAGQRVKLLKLPYPLERLDPEQLAATGQ
ncbi:YgfZ/GcvT domain-containing protein [Halomonas urumqiensis]|uniref:Folate-binding protein n=1 Tax=Halomonas urumqiensis TaxID=1684789 RepID=A0A2N7UPM4_9GAMM|nr:folate-binding protein YgfZ [Halomonas urumqiensis]PMR82389.1 folate-binding protein [Halomonas urumqiensis]PTB04132.1 folate-binding protein [Halomonas urumqiensis]GHE19600.1 tRNA-modifying protein YgfZ [Halomonas urumqiensis]